MAALLVLFLTGCGQPDTPVTVTPPDNGNVEASETTDFTVTPIDPAASGELRDQAYTNVPGTPPPRMRCWITPSPSSRRRKRKSYTR